MFETILLATVGSPQEEAVFSCAQRLALGHGSKVVVVSVAAASSGTLSVHRQIEQLRQQGVHARLAIVADGRDKASVIAHLVGAWRADLVMVSGAADPALAQRIVESCSCPVLAFPDLAVSVRPQVPVEGAPSRARS